MTLRKILNETKQQKRQGMFHKNTSIPCHLTNTAGPNCQRLARLRQCTAHCPKLLCKARCNVNPRCSLECTHLTCLRLAGVPIQLAQHPEIGGERSIPHNLYFLYVFDNKAQNRI